MKEVKSILSNRPRVLPNCLALLFLIALSLPYMRITETFSFSGWHVLLLEPIWLFSAHYPIYGSFSYHLYSTLVLVISFILFFYSKNKSAGLSRALVALAVIAVVYSSGFFIAPNVMSYGLLAGLARAFKFLSWGYYAMVGVQVGMILLMAYRLKKMKVSSLKLQTSGQMMKL